MEQSQVLEIEAGKLIVVSDAPVEVSKHLVYWWAYLPTELLGLNSSDFFGRIKHICSEATAKSFKDFEAKEIVATYINAGEPWSIKYATIVCGHFQLLSTLLESGNTRIIRLADFDNHPLALHP